jgi:hypothetical protein
MRLKRITQFATALLFILTHQLQAQKELPLTDNKFFTIGIGLPMYKTRDLAHSPLKYGGYPVQYRLGIEEMTQTRITRFLLTYTTGNISPSTKPRPQKGLSAASLDKIQATYAYYSRADNNPITNLNTYYGGAISLTFDFRFYNLPTNNLIGYNITAALNPGGILRYATSDNNSYNFEFNTSLIAYNLRPNYLGTLAANETNASLKNILKTGNVTTFHKLFNLYTRFGLETQSKEYRQNQFNYTWEFNRNTLSKPTQSITAGLSWDNHFKL